MVFSKSNYPPDIQDFYSNLILEVEKNVLKLMPFLARYPNLCWK